MRPAGLRLVLLRRPPVDDAGGSAPTAEELAAQKAAEVAALRVVIPRGLAVLCVECEVTYSSRAGACPACGSGVGVNVARALDGRTPGD